MAKREITFSIDPFPLAHLRLFLFCFGLLASSILFAQLPEEVQLSVRFGPATTEDHEKQIFESLRDLDPTGTYHYDRSVPGMTLRSSAGIPLGEYLATFSRIPGLVVVSTTDNSIAAARGTEQVDLPGFPSYIDSGDRVLDNLRYQEAKQAWILTHSAEYEVLRNTPTK